MARVLYIGGSGEISTACIEASLHRSDEVAVFNRGNSVNDRVQQFTGDISARDAYQSIKDQRFDVVCQFLAFQPKDIERDVEFFKSRCQQYIFISSASVYQKPSQQDITLESTPLDNPFWPYAQAKIACEEKLISLAGQHGLNYTIVRPSHTYRTRLPGAVINGYHQTWRMLNHKPVIVHGDGQSVWTLTHANDFAAAFAKLVGNEAAFNQDFHITRDNADSWQHILETVAETIGVEAEIVAIPTQQLIEQVPDWRGPLLGDKANSMQFNNDKVRSVIGEWQCEVSLSEGLSMAWQETRPRLTDFSPSEAEDAQIDQLISAFQTS